jgi:hypothetical protein
MPRTLILNQSNIIAGSGNSAFLYNFPLGGIEFKDEFIAVQQISLYNSVFNISTTNNNNSFSYIWVDGTTTTISLPDSYLELAEINATLQAKMVANKHYMLTSTGAYVYFLEIVVNPSRYADQINSFQLSATIATANSWTQPSGATWVLPTNAINPIFVVPNTSFQKVIGFTAGKYPNATITGTPPAQVQTPAYTSTQSFLSSSAPQIIPQPSYLCVCSLVNNRLAIPSQLVFSLTPQDVNFGALYSYQVSDLAFNKIEDGQYTQFTFRFVDSLGQPIYFQDPNTLILLIIKSKGELGYSMG